MTKHEIYSQRRLTESYWPADTTQPLHDWTVAQVLRDTAKEVPDRLALVEGTHDPSESRKWTYAQLLADSERVATSLLKKFRPGEHIAVWAPNMVEWVLAEFGCAIAGLTVVTVNPSFKAKELDYVLRQSQAAGIFVAEEYRGHHMLTTASEVQKKLPSLREVICFSDFDEFIEIGNDKSISFPDVKANDPFVIMYTSGTTGNPKGAILHNKGITNSTKFMAERAGMEVGGVWVNVMPLVHCGGCGFAVLGTLQQQGTHVLVPGFDPELFLKLVEREKGTFALLVPTMVEAILNFPEREKYQLSTLHSLLSGASKVEPHLVHRIKKELGCGISIVCGQTEMHGGTTQTHLDDSAEDQAETIGQPYPHIEVKIANPSTGEILPLGQEGEICCRGYQTMIGYYQMPEQTAATLKEDGWIHSGDIGTMDERGFIKIKGRLKDMIIRGGVNIYPTEIEALLKEHPLIQDVAVVGVPDEYWGEQVSAIVVPKSSENLPLPEELEEYCKANMASYKRPRFWVFVDEFPTTPAGKIQKFKLREIAKNNFKAQEDASIY
ncbi:class I adenylate-forming enzyme family protein [Bacillus sp. EB600]|uniref:class I adenylate-forming enzyme family protein n=1 Tax=Bacillus sp. EB600 TaxID=2806345 RepID=UPI002108D8A0|nr:AMP-binding protein [Bacillus sp. EB600]MCQ6281659.1 AMP-binding protein [Bacillus sp. EB600]